MTSRPPEWVKDSQRRQCVQCATIFTMFRRQHHCRHCGEIFCDECSSKRLALSIRPNEPVRICDACYAKATKKNDSETKSTDLRSSSFSEGVETDAPASKDTKGDHGSDVLVTEVSVVSWSRGEKRKVHLKSPLHVGESVSIGQADPTAKVELETELRPSGDRVTTSFVVSDFIENDKSVVKLNDDVSLRVRLRRAHSAQAVVVSGRRLRYVAIGAFVMLVVVPLWSLLIVLLMVPIDNSVVDDDGDSERMAKTTLEIVAHFARTHCGMPRTALYAESVTGLAAVLSLVCVHLVRSLLLRTPGESTTLELEVVDLASTTTTRPPASTNISATSTKTSTSAPSSHHPAYVRTAIEAAVKNVLSMAGHAAEGKAYCTWSPYGSKGNVKYFMAESASLGGRGGVAIKGFLPYVPVRPEAIVKLLGLPYDDPRKRKLNPDTNTITVLKRFDNRTLVNHQRNHGLWPTTPREIVMAVHIRKLDDDKIVLAVKSVDSPLAPREEPKKWVRMQVYSAGWVLEPVRNAQGRRGTRATYVNHFDPMGGIPTWVVKKGSSINLGQLARMKDMLLETPEDFRGLPTMTNETHEIWPPLAPSQSSSVSMDNDEARDDAGATKEDARNASSSPAAALPPHIAKAIEVAVRNIRSMAGAKGEKPYCSWSPYGSDRDVKYFMAEGGLKGGGVAIKGILPFVPVPPIAIVTILGLPADDPRKQRLSPDVDVATNLVRHDNHTTTKHQRNKAIWPTAPREMVMAVHIRKMDDGNVVVAVRSVVSPAAPPEDANKCVRMRVESAGWLLEPVEKDGRRGTRATYVNHFDPCGGIPKWVVKKGSSKNLAQVATLRDIVNERATEYGKIAPMENSTFEICSELAPASDAASVTKKSEPVKSSSSSDVDSLRKDQLRVLEKKETPVSLSSPTNATELDTLSSPPRSSFRRHQQHDRLSGLPEVSNTCCGGWIPPLSSPRPPRTRARKFKND